MLPLIAVGLVLLLLVGCGSTTPTLVAEAPATTSEPEQVAATPTLEPATATPTPEPPAATPTSEPPSPTPEPPTATPTPPIVDPQPGAILKGSIEDSENASGMMMSLELSEDGTSITTLTFILTSVSKCEGMNITISEGSEMSLAEAGPFPVTEGRIDASLPNGGELKGRFISPTEASGTITVKGLAYSDACQIGPSNWSAKAE
jgi:hypothetical protein